MIAFLSRCVKHGVEVAACYLRTNRNVAAEEITRLEETELATRGGVAQKRLTRESLPDQWGAFSRFIPHLDLGRVRTERRAKELTVSSIASLHGKVAEWNASANTPAGTLEGICIKTQPVYFRFGQVMSQLQRWMICGASAKRPLIFLGTSHNGQEVRASHYQLGEIQHPIGVLVAPSELAEFPINGPVWAQHFWIDSAAIGDVLGGSWGVYLRTRKSIMPPHRRLYRRDDASHKVHRH